MILTATGIAALLVFAAVGLGIAALVLRSGKLGIAAAVALALLAFYVAVLVVSVSFM